MKVIKLREGKDRSLLRRHPWVFQGSIEKGKADVGETVRVEGSDGAFLAWGAYHGALLLVENWLGVKPLRPHRTPRWRLWLRYGVIQGAVAGGMFAFIGWTS